MLEFFLIAAGLLAILLVEEISWRKKILHGEYQRKLSHITVATFAAFWPWFASWGVVEFFSIALLLAAALNHYTKWFNFLAGIRRKDLGHVFFPLAFLICALLAPNRVYYTVAVLQLALADGLAAVIGTTYGKRTSYKIFGATKSLVGSVTFWLVSLATISVGLLIQPGLTQPVNYAWLVIFLPPALTVIENVSIKGTDNLTVPVIALLVLSWFA